MVLESIREVITLQELASKHSLHPTQITAWEAGVLEKADTVFGSESQLKRTKPREGTIFQNW